MKNIILITVLFLALLPYKAQQPIIPLYNGSDYLDTQNAYCKDTGGDLTKLSGSWIYINGSEIFKLVLEKKVQHSTEFPATGFICYEDLLFGEYNYIDSTGLEIVDTLSNLNATTDPYEHAVYGGYIKSHNEFPICDNCAEDERRVSVFIQDPLRSYFDYEMIIRHIPGEDLTGMGEKIKVTIKRTDMAIVPQGQPSNDRILIDEIILDKQ